MVFFSYLSFLGICLALQKKTKVNIELTPIVSVSIIISILYIFSLLKLLNFGYLLTFFVGCICLLYALIQNRKSCITPGFFFWSLTLLVFSLMSFNLSYSEWDEFSHWGYHAKIIWLNNSLPSSSDNVNHITYPPGANLFQYFFLKTAGYSENIAYLAQLLILTSPLSIFLQNFKWLDWRKALVTLLALICIISIFKAKVGLAATLYVDSIVSIWASALLYQGVNARSKNSKICLIPVFFTFVLFKVKVFPIVLVIIGVIFINYLYTYFIEEGEEQHKAKELKFHCFIILSYFLSAFISLKIWDLYLIYLNILLEWKIEASIFDIYNSFFNPSVVQKIITTNFLNKAFGHFSYIIIFLSLICFSLVNYSTKKEKFRWVIIHSLIFLGLIGYYFGLLLSYLFVFDEYEAVNLLSMSRYTNMYYLMWAIIIIKEVLFILKNYRYNYISKVFIFSSVFALTFYFTFLKYFNSENLYVRDDIKKITSSLKYYGLSNSDKLFIIWQNSTGFEKNIISYEVLPISITSSYSSVGKKYKNNDVWTKPVSVEKFRSDLKEFDYLLLAHTDDNFWNLYSSLFSKDKKNMIPLTKYQICKGKGFNEYYTKNCENMISYAYLFKIYKVNDSIKLVNVAVNNK